MQIADEDDDCLRSAHQELPRGIVKGEDLRLDRVLSNLAFLAEAVPEDAQRRLRPGPGAGVVLTDVDGTVRRDAAAPARLTVGGVERFVLRGRAQEREHHV